MKPKGQLSKLPPGTPLELAMGVLGLTGITAYFGLLEVGRGRVRTRRSPHFEMLPT